MTEISSWSQTDASNNSPPPAGAPENQMPSTVNDVMRAMMGGSARRYARATPIVTAGTATAYTVTYAVAPAALVNGETFLLEFHVACGAAPTVAINGLTAVPIHKYSGGAWVVLAAGDAGANSIARVAYNSVAGAMRIISSSSADDTDTFGMVELADSGAIAAASAFDFTAMDDALYGSYLVVFDNVRPSTLAASFRCRASIDAGATWLTTVHSYIAMAWNAAEPFNSGNVSTASLPLAGGVDTAGFGVSGAMEIIGAAATMQATRVNSHVDWIFSPGSAWFSQFMRGSVGTASKVNAFRFDFDTGTIASGRIRVYGLVA